MLTYISELVSGWNFVFLARNLLKIIEYSQEFNYSNFLRIYTFTNKIWYSTVVVSSFALSMNLIFWISDKVEDLSP